MAEPRRIVLKIGTSTLSGPDGLPDAAFLASIADQLVPELRQGRRFLLVTSGAIGAGRAVLGYKAPPEDVPLRQVCAAVGQPRLMRAWEEAFAPHRVPVAQVLVTYHDLANVGRSAVLRKAVELLLEHGALPVVNENDTVSTEEIGASFGDNDRLSALLACALDADLLVLLSDVDGVYTKPPGTPGAERIAHLPRVTPWLRRRVAQAKAGTNGRGGMASKLAAAALANGTGIPVVIADGRTPGIVNRVLAGEHVGTRVGPLR